MLSIKQEKGGESPKSLSGLEGYPHGDTSIKSQILLSNYYSDSQNNFNKLQVKELKAGKQHATESQIIVRANKQFKGEMHTSKSDESLNTVQNLAGLETQIVKYEADIRKHISIEH